MTNARHDRRAFAFERIALTLRRYGQRLETVTFARGTQPSVILLPFTMSISSHLPDRSRPYTMTAVFAFALAVDL